ncbi:MAG TPA: hypothetical protein VHC97_05755 [Thermoanaerobaculia bacterium]|jgi:hypothetical protein|nr:hypothetical protein [Thermoanaerobaculia bacterium]
MKKMVLGLSLVTLGFLVSPALAADPPQAPGALSVADQAFLASLARQAGTPDPVPAAKRPGRIGEKALCNATARCSDGSTVYCESNVSATSCSAVDNNCPNEQGHVTCNGTTTWCPPCPSGGCGPDFCSDQDDYNCSLSCYPCSYTLVCNTTYCTERCRCNFRTCPV